MRILIYAYITMALTSLTSFCMEKRSSQELLLPQVDVQKISDSINEQFSVFLFPNALSAISLPEKDCQKIIEQIQKKPLTLDHIKALDKNCFVQQSYEFYAQKIQKKFQNFSLKDMPHLSDITKYSIPHYIQEPLRNYIMQRACNTLPQKYDVSFDCQGSTVKSWDISKDRELFGLITNDNKVLLWNLRDGSVKNLPYNKKIAENIRFSPTKKFIAISRNDEQTGASVLQKWDCSTLELITEWHEAPYCLYFMSCPTDTTILALGKQKHNINGNMRQYFFSEEIEQPTITELHLTGELVIGDSKNENTKSGMYLIRYRNQKCFDRVIVYNNISHPVYFFLLKAIIQNSKPNDNLDTIKTTDAYKQLYPIEQHCIKQLIKKKR